MYRKFLTSALVAVAGTLAFSGIAHAAPPSHQTLKTILKPKKQHPKKFGGAKLRNVISTFYPDFIASPSPLRTVFTIDKNVKFVNGNLRACPLGAIQGRPSAVAESQCRRSIVGKGIVEANYGAIRGEVLLISGGKRTMYVHTDLAGGALVIVITGQITKRKLIFTGIPNTPGTSLTKFDTVFFKKRTSNKKKGKFYVMARCAGKKKKAQKWSTTETTTFYNGQTLSASSKTQRCKQRKKK